MRLARIERHYDRLAQSGPMWPDAPIIRMMDALKEEWVHQALPPKGGRILDAGGGDGKWTVRLASLGYRVDLADVSEGMLELARETVRRRGLGRRVRVHRCDLRDLPFEDGRFQFVLVEGDVLSITPGPGRVLRELRRVLALGGTVSACVCGFYNGLFQTMRDNPGKVEEFLANPVLRNNGMDFRTYTPEQVGGLFEGSGLRVVRLGGELVYVDKVLRDGDAAELGDEGVFQAFLGLERDALWREELVPFGARIQIIAKRVDGHHR